MTQVLRTWQDVEDSTVEFFSNNLNDDYIVVQHGGSNSFRPDVSIYSPDEQEFSVEIKKIPSIAGIQVVTTTTNYPYIPSANITWKPAFYLCEMKNKQHERGNARLSKQENLDIANCYANVLLERGVTILAFEYIDEHKSVKTGMINVRDIGKYFEMKINAPRAKGSGSGRYPRSKDANIPALLQEIGVEATFERLDGRILISPTKPIEENDFVKANRFGFAVTAFDDSVYQLSKRIDGTFELRTRSKTSNPTLIVNIHRVRRNVTIPPIDDIESFLEECGNSELAVDEADLYMKTCI